VLGFLAWGSVPPPLAWNRGAEMLEAGSWCEWRRGDVVRRGRFADARDVYQSAMNHGPESDPDALRTLAGAAVRDSVRAHLIADVPVGVFLSGGIDSSLLAALAAQESAGAVRTFSIGFEEKSFDELSRARTVARRYGTDHHELVLRPDAAALLPEIAAAFDEPFADSSALPTYAVSRLASEHVKVALSGEGGDEVLGGYARYFWGPVMDRLRPTLGRHAGQVLRVTNRLPSRSLGVFNVARRAAKAAESVQLDSPERYLAWFDIFNAEERRSLLGDGADSAAQRFAALFDAARDLRLDPVQRLQYVDIHTMLLDNLLMKADKISMAHSLEVRVPFVSRDLVEFGLGLPAAQKVGLLRDKRLMRRLLRPKLGTRIAHRPKRGFEIPVDRWFREKTTEALRQQLRSGAVVKHLGFNPRAVDRLIERHLGQEDIGRKLFALAGLERWAQHYA